MHTNHSSGAMGKPSGTKRDDSRRRAAHTAAEQKRRNAIRVIRKTKHILHYSIFLRKDMMLYKVLYRIVIYLILSVHKKSVKQQYLNDVSDIEKRIFLIQNRILSATDYLMQLNKEKQQLTNQLEIKRKDTFCLRAVQKFVSYSTKTFYSFNRKKI